MNTCSTPQKRIRVSVRCAIALFAALLAPAAGSALALDVDDVRNLMTNQVPEQVIVNMIRSDGGIYITTEEADEFRAMGASENLIAELRPRAILTDPATIAPSPTITQPAQPQTVIVDAAPLDGSPVSLAPVASAAAYPPRYDKEGWLSISNRDWIPYYISINPGNKRVFISKAPNGGMLVQSGENVVVNIRKETYKMYGDTGESLSVRVRENETTTLSLNPFGVFGNSGLSGVVTDRDRVRSETLFNNYAPPPTTVVVQEEPQVIVVPGPRYRPYHYFGPPHRRHRRGGDGMFFHFNW